ncbi:hypothetical protein P350_31550 [Burkholderia cepacia JBK9]|nr:hypothetical protein P350_31550 [Burkholderia cepacia JBK9]
MEDTVNQILSVTIRERKPSHQPSHGMRQYDRLVAMILSDNLLDTHQARLFLGLRVFVIGTIDDLFRGSVIRL